MKNYTSPEEKSMNNDDIIRSVICMFAIDGEISKQEMQFLQHLCQKLGVSQEVVKETFAQARQGKGKVHLSDDASEMSRLFNMLLQAAVVDGEVRGEERKVLNAVAAKIGIPEANVEKYLTEKLKHASSSSPGKTPSKKKTDQNAPKKPASSGGASRSSKTSKEPETTSQESDTLMCPKCGFIQAPKGQCVRCGTVLRKFKREPSQAKRKKSKNTIQHVPTVTTKSLINPHIWIKKDVLYARTAFLKQLFSLFFFCREVEVDRRQREIRVTTRWLWFLTTKKTIPFSRFTARSPIETTFTADLALFADRRRLEYEYRRREYEPGGKYSIILHLEDPYEKYGLITFKAQAPCNPLQLMFFLFEFVSALIFGTSPGEEVFQEYLELLQEFTAILGHPS